MYPTCDDEFNAAVDKAVYALSRLIRANNHNAAVDMFGQEMFGEFWDTTIRPRAIDYIAGMRQFKIDAAQYDMLLANS